MIEELKWVRDSDLTARVLSWDRNISCLFQTLGQMNQCEYMQMKDRKTKGRRGKRKKKMSKKMKNRCKEKYVQKRKRETHKTLYTTAQDRCYCVPQGSERKRVGRIQGKKRTPENMF